MEKSDFAWLLIQVRNGALTSGQMEDLVYAMHSAYMDHEPAISMWMPCTLEEFADSMVLARKNSECDIGCEE